MTPETIAALKALGVTAGIVASATAGAMVWERRGLKKDQTFAEWKAEADATIKALNDKIEALYLEAGAIKAKKKVWKKTFRIENKLAKLKDGYADWYIKKMAEKAQFDADVEALWRQVDEISAERKALKYRYKQESKIILSGLKASKRLAKAHIDVMAMKANTATSEPGAEQATGT